MKSEQAYRDEIEKEREAYHKALATKPAHVAAEHSAKVKDLQADLGKFLAKGANACPTCEAEPFGMLKRESYTDRDGIEQPTLYEVGCLTCPERSRAVTSRDAVAKWNKGEYVKERAR